MGLVSIVIMIQIVAIVALLGVVNALLHRILILTEAQATHDRRRARDRNRGRNDA
jgi:hypothetical protein